MVHMVPKLSIVIPVYNSERYLPECLDSILAQDFSDYEVICIDDGSTDKSREVLSSYSGKDCRFLVITQEHKGPGVARNKGLAKASGEYLYFMDSDDCLGDEAALSFIVGQMEQSSLDLLCISSRLRFENEQLKEKRYREVQYYASQKEYGFFSSGEELFRELAAGGKFVPSVWLHCLRRSFLQRERLDFMDTLRWEDMVFIFKAMLLAGRVQHAARQLYVRRVREGSLMTEPESFLYVRDAVRAFQEMTDFLMSRAWRRETKEVAFQHLARQAQEIDKRFHALPREEQKKKDALPPQVHSYANLMLMMVPVFRRQMASYVFPHHLFHRGERVLIYGAGNVGREFYEQAIRDDFIGCVGIIDKRASSLALEDLPVRMPEDLAGVFYDKVLIAVQDRMLAESVRQDLHSLGVPDEKIAWDGPHYLMQDFYRGYYYPLLEKLHEEKTRIG